jgi:hypothetical protein
MTTSHTSPKKTWVTTIKRLGHDMAQAKWVIFMGLQVSEVADVNNGGNGCVNAQSECMHEWGVWKEWLANPHNDKFPLIKLHVPRLTHGSLGSSSLSTCSLFLSPNELRITWFISPNLSIFRKIYYNIPLAISPLA